MPDTAESPVIACACAKRPSWARVEDDAVLRWPVVEVGEWEEIRHCPDCNRPWLTIWPEETENAPLLCRPVPDDTRRLKDIDHPRTLRKYCLARLQEHFGELKEQKQPCRKVQCERNRLEGVRYCLEHLIAQRFGRHLAMIERDKDE